MLLEKRLSILGVGKMGGALASGLVRSGAMRASHLRLYDSHASRAQDFAIEIGGEPLPKIAASAVECVEGSDIILLAVKPPIVSQVLQDLAPHLSSSQLVISIAAGVRLQKMESLLSASVPVIRAMPNTPALVGEGATALSPGIHATPSHIAQAQALFSAVGMSVVVEERLMDAVTGLSGSGPAYVYLMIEALMDDAASAGSSLNQREDKTFFCQRNVSFHVALVVSRKGVAEKLRFGIEPALHARIGTKHRL